MNKLILFCCICYISVSFRRTSKQVKLLVVVEEDDVDGLMMESKDA